MLISNHKKFLFIHVPKTGGTSLVAILKEFSNRPNIFLRSIGYFFDDRGYKLPEFTYNIFGYPYHVRSEQMFKLLDRNVFDNYFKFAFVRNPYDLTVSEYFYIKKIKTHQHHKAVNQIKSFDDFVIWKKVHYARPQTNWILGEKDEVLVDYIGKFEQYEKDANYILSKLGVNKTVPHLNITKKKHYLEYYKSRQTIDIVTQIYKKDFKFFNYTIL